MNDPQKTQTPRSASEADADALLSIAIEEDGMRAVVSEYRPATGNGVHPTTSSIQKALEQAGVVFQPEEAILSALIERIARKEDITGYVLVKGIPPKQPKDARIELFGNQDLPVFRGEAFGRVIPATHAEPGKTLRGEDFPAPEDREVKDIELSENAGYQVDEETLSLRSKGYGLVRLDEKGVRVKPLSKLTKDKLAILSTVYAADFFGRPITLERMKNSLDEMGVRMADDSAISKAIVEAGKTGAPQKDVAIARGKDPIQGEDGRFELMLEQSGIAADDDMADADPRERSAFVSVEEGDLIGNLIPAKHGEAGVDVFGNAIEPDEVSEADVGVGEGVEASADSGSFTATVSGMVSWRGNKMCVLDFLEIKGDVDFHTGNITQEKGSIKITGSVRDGFKVISPNDVIVGGSIDSSFVTAGGSINVQYGITMGGNGLVKAGGDIAARFAETAHIEAGGNVAIGQNITNCEIAAGGKVTCTSGKGLLQGGTIRAVGGLECNEIGSDYGIVTTIIIGENEEPEDQLSLVQEKKDLKMKIRKIEEALGAEPTDVILKKVPESKKEKVAGLLKLRDDGKMRLYEIDRLREQARQEFLDAAKARVRVRKLAHPGTTVRFGGKVFKLQEPLNGGVIFYNPQTNAIMAG